MNLTRFPEQTIVFAEDQPEYLPLPAYQEQERGVPLRERSFPIVCVWKLSWKERLKLLFTGLLYHRILTFAAPLQPQMLLVDKPPMPPHVPETF